MPIYEYQCRGCCHQFEELVRAFDAPHPPCPQCQCTDVEKLLSAGFLRPNGIPTGSGGFKAPACKPSG